MNFHDVAKAIAAPIIRMFYKVEVLGVENVPMDEPLIFASNHKSNLDPLLIGAFMPRNVCYMAKKELFKNKLLGYILNKLNVFPVDRNKTGASTIKVALKILKSKQALGIFPEGTRVKGDKPIKAKAGTAMLAIKGKAKICPVSIIGNYKLFSKITLYIDKPVSFEEYYGEKLTSKDYEDISQKVLDIINRNMKNLA